MPRKPVDFTQSRREMTRPAKEILDHMYKVLLATPPFTLADGSKVAMERYYAPEVDLDGELHCGVDVRLENGGHLEFTVKNTGWGKSFMNELAAKRTHKPGRQR